MQNYPQIHEGETKKKKGSLSQLQPCCLLSLCIFMLPELHTSLGTPADPVCIIIAAVTTTQTSSHMQGAWQSNGQACKPSTL